MAKEKRIYFVLSCLIFTELHSTNQAGFQEEQKKNNKNNIKIKEKKTKDNLTLETWFLISFFASLKVEWCWMVVSPSIWSLTWIHARFANKQLRRNHTAFSTTSSIYFQYALLFLFTRNSLKRRKKSYSKTWRFFSHWHSFQTMNSAEHIHNKISALT